jgi:hypothetical protein
MSYLVVGLVETWLPVWGRSIGKGDDAEIEGELQVRQWLRLPLISEMGY